MDILDWRAIGVGGLLALLGLGLIPAIIIAVCVGIYLANKPTYQEPS